MERSIPMSASPAKSAPSRGFAPNHPWDRNFFLVMVALAWLGILRGFGGDIAEHVLKVSEAGEVALREVRLPFYTGPIPELERA